MLAEAVFNRWIVISAEPSVELPLNLQTMLMTAKESENPQATMISPVTTA